VANDFSDIQTQNRRNSLELLYLIAALKQKAASLHKVEDAA
jgi:hypothetical protein